MSSAAASKAYFAKMKAMADKIDAEVSRLESEVRRKVILTRGDDAGFAAPVCDEMSDAIDEMSNGVEALTLEVEKNRQELNQQIGKALDTHDYARRVCKQALDYGSKYGYQPTDDELAFVNTELNIEEIRQKIVDKKSRENSDEQDKELAEQMKETVADLASPNLFSMGISKQTLQRMGVHFRSGTHNQELMHQSQPCRPVEGTSQENRDTRNNAVMSPVEPVPTLNVTVDKSQIRYTGQAADFEESFVPPPVRQIPGNLDDESTDGYSPAASILKTSMAMLPDASMEASRVEISPGLKVKRPQQSKGRKLLSANDVKSKHSAPVCDVIEEKQHPLPSVSSCNDSYDIPEFNTVNVESFLRQFKADDKPVHAGYQQTEQPVHLPKENKPVSEKKPVADTTDCLASPELPILKTMDISKLFHNTQAAVPKANSGAIPRGTVSSPSPPPISGNAYKRPLEKQDSKVNSSPQPNPTPPKGISCKENLLASPEGEDEIMALLQKYDRKK